MEQEQFKQEVLILRSQLLVYANHILNDREGTEDIIQEVFLKLWHIRKELDRYHAVPALAFQITKNLCLNRLKVRDRTGSFPEGYDLSDNSLSPHMALEQKDNVRHVMHIIDQLPGLQQSVLRMRHVDGFEVEEIAELTGSSPEAIRMNLSRARKRVKELFFKMEKR